MRRHFLCFLLLVLFGCQGGGVLDLSELEGKARGGDTASFRELVRLLSVEGNDVNEKVYQIILALGKDSVPWLLEQVDTKDRVQRERVVAALGTLKAKEGVAAIAKVLSNPSLGRRYVAAWSLGEIGDPSGISPLLNALDDDDAEVRKYATRSLIKMNTAAVLPLIEYLGRSTARGEGGAIRALGDIGDQRALDPLLKRVDGPNRLDIFLALGKLKDPRAQETLISGLEDEDWKVRMNAAMALGPLGGKEAASPLRKTLEDDVHVVREWSARSLEMITGEHITYRNEKGEYVPPYNIYH